MAFLGCSVLWHFLLAVFWRGVAFLEGAFSVLWRGVAFLESVLGSVTFWSVLGSVTFWEGCGIFGGHLQCFGGVWHFWRALVVFACSVLEVRDILEEALPVFWRGVVFLEGACHGGIFEGCLQYFGGT